MTKEALVVGSLVTPAGPISEGTSVGEDPLRQARNHPGMTARVWRSHRQYVRTACAFLLAMLLINVEAGDAVAQTGTIVGRVVEAETRRPMQGVEISLRGTGLRTLTSDVGRFAFTQMDIGVYWLVVRFLGYAERVDSVRVAGEGVAEIEVELAVSPVRLRPLTITVNSRSIDAWLGGKGFMDRGAAGTALFHATYEQLRVKHFRNLEELLRNVPGVRIRRLADGGTELVFTPDRESGREACRIGVYLNGSFVELGRFNYSGANWSDRASRPMRFDDLVRMEQIDGLEIYGPDETPVAADDSCGALMIWASQLRPTVNEEFTGDIRGTATDASTGHAVPGVRVTLDGTGLSAETDESGGFTIRGVLPGRYTLSAEFRDTVPWRSTVRVLAHGSVELTLRLERR